MNTERSMRKYLKKFVRWITSLGNVVPYEHHFPVTPLLFHYTLANVVEKWMPGKIGSRRLDDTHAVSLSARDLFIIVEGLKAGYLDQAMGRSVRKWDEVF